MFRFWRLSSKNVEITFLIRIKSLNWYNTQKKVQFYEIILEIINNKNKFVGKSLIIIDLYKKYWKYIHIYIWTIHYCDMCEYS